MTSLDWRYYHGEEGCGYQERSERSWQDQQKIVKLNCTSGTWPLTSLFPFARTIPFSLSVGNEDQNLGLGKADNVFLITDDTSSTYAHYTTSSPSLPT